MIEPARGAFSTCQNACIRCEGADKRRWLCWETGSLCIAWRRAHTRRNKERSVQHQVSLWPPIPMPPYALRRVLALRNLFIHLYWSTPSSPSDSVNSNGLRRNGEATLTSLEEPLTGARNRLPWLLSLLIHFFLAVIIQSNLKNLKIL